MARRVSSLKSSTLFTPPETPRTPKDTPFKPKDDDNISLSMKKRHKGGQHGTEVAALRECLSNNDVKSCTASKQTPLYPQYSKSLPNLRESKVYPACKVSPQRKMSGHGSGFPDRRRRRWTLPSKAASTTFLAHTVFAVPVQTPSRKKKCAAKNNSSPAVITLRRATNSTASPRRVSLTFFPEPTFQRSRSGFLSSFLNTLTHAENMSDVEITETHQQNNRRSSRSASVGEGEAKPSSSERAPPVCTEVAEVQPQWSIPGKASSDFPPRRCSTRFISAGVVYEVIWDENGSSVSSESLNSQPVSETDAHPSERRHSVAVETLESQLFRSVAQSRRHSLAALAQASRRTSDASDNPLSSSIGKFGISRRKSVGDILAFHLARPVQDFFFSHLPRSSRSKSITQTEHVSSTIPTVPEEAPRDGCGQPSGSIEFFPPPRSRATTDKGKATSSSVVDALASERTPPRSSTPPDTLYKRIPNQTGGIASRVGVSTHIRRRSTARDDRFARRRSNALNGVASRHSSPFIHPRTEESDDDDTSPLLKNSMGIFNSWNT